MSADYDARAAQMDGAIACVKRVSEVEARELEPLWPGVLWRGKTTLLAGDPGLGKSQIACDVAARITRGTPWPCTVACAAPGDVLMLSAEDDVSDTLRPRLEAAGADLDRVHFLSGILVNGTRQTWPSLLEHAEALRAAIEARPNLALVTIDPLTAYLGGVDSHKTAEVRGVLGVLAQLAGQYRVGVLAVSHLNKAPGGQGLYRVTGSLAFVAAARAAFLVARDPQDRDQRLVLCLKNNLAPDSEGYRYVVREADNSAPYVEWGEERVPMTADEALASLSIETPREQARSRRDTEAAEWLTNELRNGPREAASVWRASESAGYSEREVRRACQIVGVEKAQAGYQGHWHWALPPVTDRSSITATRNSLTATVRHSNGSGSHEPEYTTSERTTDVQ